MIGYSVNDYGSWARDGQGNIILTPDGKKCVPLDDDWSTFFAGLLPRGIYPTDIDGCVEINGHHLLLEHKRADALVKDGQFKSLLNLARKPNMTIMIINGYHDDGVHEVRIFTTETQFCRSLIPSEEYNEGKCFAIRKNMTTNELKYVIRTWSDMADEHITQYAPYGTFTYIEDRLSEEQFVELEMLPIPGRTQK